MLSPRVKTNTAFYQSYTAEDLLKTFVQIKLVFEISIQIKQVKLSFTYWNHNGPPNQNQFRNKVTVSPT